MKGLSTPVHQWIDAFNAHDVTRIVALYTEEAELSDPGMRHARRGQSEISTWFTQRFQQMPTIHYTPSQFFLQENAAAVCWIAQGQTPQLLKQRWLSKPFQVEGVSIFHLKADLISWQHGYYDHLSIVERVLTPLRWLPLKQ